MLTNPMVVNVIGGQKGHCQIVMSRKYVTDIH